MNKDSTQTDFDSLLDTRVSERERERLRRAHDALLRAGPLPELPASLQQPPPVAIRRLPVPSPARPNRRVLIAALAATLGLAAAGAGYLLTTGPAETIQGTAAMHATAIAPGARGVLRIGARDRAGNYPIVLRVRGLPSLPAGSYYDMYLTDKDSLVQHRRRHHDRPPERPLPAGRVQRLADPPRARPPAAKPAPSHHLDVRIWRLSKQAARYRPAPTGEVRCDRCRYMFPPVGLGGCRLVRGLIRSSATCDEFTTRRTR
jgi:hypothetical protein